MIIGYWDYSNTFMNNAKQNLIANSNVSAFARKKTNEILVNFPTQNNMYLGYDLLPYVRSRYGSMTPICLGDRIITSKISSEGAMDDIFKNQTLVVQIIDEFGDQLGHMLNDSGGYLKAVSAKMKNLYSQTDGIYQSGRYSSAGGKQKTAKPWSLSRPCYGLTGITTQTQFLSVLNENMLHDGFLNRFEIGE